MIKWEEVDTLSPNTTLFKGVSPQSNDAEEGIEIFVKDRYIYVVTDHELKASVYTILGQIIVTEDLKPGVYRLPINSRGIYIVRAGVATMRVTL